jgi:hypothetical protein
MPISGLSEREGAAVQKVREVLRVTSVRHHDDGSRDGLYDVELTIADGRRVAMEITSLQNEAWHQARSARNQHAGAYEGRSLSHRWIVMADAERVRMRTLAPKLEPLLHDLEAAGVSDVTVERPHEIIRLPAGALSAALELRALHVHHVLHAVDGPYPDDSPRILLALSRSEIGTPGVLGASLSELFADGHNQRKLARATDCDELHLFVDVEDASGLVLGSGVEPPACPVDPTETLTWVWAWTGHGDCSGLVFRARPGASWERYNLHTGEHVRWNNAAEGEARS